MKVAFLGGLSVPEGQVPLFLSAPALTLQLELGTIGPKEKVHDHEAVDLLSCR